MYAQVFQRKNPVIKMVKKAGGCLYCTNVYIFVMLNSFVGFLYYRYAIETNGVQLHARSQYIKCTNIFVFFF